MEKGNKQDQYREMEDVSKPKGPKEKDQARYGDDWAKEPGGTDVKEQPRKGLSNQSNWWVDRPAHVINNDYHPDDRLDNDADADHWGTTIKKTK